MPKWTHRPTWEEYHDSDRLICCDGRAVGRTYQHKGGPQDGRWLWAGMWIGPDNQGTVETFDAALESVRSRFELIRKTRSIPPSSLPSAGKTLRMTGRESGRMV